MSSMANQAREMGACRVVPNVRFTYVRTASGYYPEQEPILPYSDVSFYFREYEHQEINHWYGSAGPFDESSVKVGQHPEHGVLVEAKCEEHHAYCNHQAYYYRPEVGYFGQDSAIIDAEVNGFSVRVRYYFHSMDTAAFQRAEVCDKTGLDWKISESRGVQIMPGTSAGGTRRYDSDDRPVHRPSEIMVRAFIIRRVQ